MKRIHPWILPLSLLFLWFLAGETRAIPPYLLPHPLTVGETACTYILAPPGSAPYAGRFLQDAAASLLRVFPGFFIAAAAGLPAGVISGRMPAVRRLLGSSVSAARAVPGICWLPLALVWFGIGRNTTIFLVALAAFFPIYLNALTGVKSVDPVLLRAGAMLGTRGARSVFRILLPAAMPQIVGGLRLGLGLSWAYLVLGELTGVPDGLGAVIMDARMLGRIDIILVGIILIALLGRLSDLLLVAGLKTCLKSARRTV